MLDLEKLIAPASLEAFLQEDFGHQWKCFRGDEGRFSHLLSQDTLLNLLNGQEMPLGNVVMIHHGETLAPELYGHPGTQPKSIRPDAQRIQQHLEQGAALLVTHVERIHRPLLDLAESLGIQFREAVTVNVYLGGPNSKGFDLHIDHHDVLVFQAWGNKQWEVRKPTTKHPLVLPEHMTEPPTDIEWEGTLKSGDILYLPRGYWHRAEAQEETSLHLTFGIQPCTGLHFLGWLRKSLLANEAFRADIPRHSANLKQGYLDTLRQILEELQTTEQLETFLSDHEKRITVERHSIREKLHPSN